MDLFGSRALISWILRLWGLNKARNPLDNCFSLPCRWRDTVSLTLDWPIGALLLCLQLLPLKSERTVLGQCFQAASEIEYKHSQDRESRKDGTFDTAPNPLGNPPTDNSERENMVGILFFLTYVQRVITVVNPEPASRVQAIAEDKDMRG